MIFRFASPWFLLLLAVPWAWWASGFLKGIGRSGSGRDQTLALHLSSLGTGAESQDPPPSTPALVAARLLPLFKVVAMSLMVLALAAPRPETRR